MRTTTSFLACTALTAALCAPSLLRIPLLLPLLNADVRRAVPHVMKELRTQGWWLVHAELTTIDQSENELCFHWLYRYRSKNADLPPRMEDTCISRNE